MEQIITIIGLGNIGKTMGALLLAAKAPRLQLNILDPDPEVAGAVLDLAHAAGLYPGHRIAFNSQELLNHSDYIFHCAGASVPRGQSRLVTCQASIDMTEAIFSAFRPAKAPFVIVVANPVDIITGVTARLTGLPPGHVIGTGTLLDSVRMDHVVRQACPDISSLRSVLLGEHGAAAFLSDQLSHVDGHPFSQRFSADRIAAFMTAVKGSAEQIKATQKATIYGVSHCALRIYEALRSSEPEQMPVSTYLPDSLRAELGTDSLYLSLYSSVSQRGAHPAASYQPAPAELQQLCAARDLITSALPLAYR